ncbi:17458_t:CDS:1, partial [Cetraspora pellucida]
MIGDGQNSKPMQHDIILQLHEGPLKRISELHRAYQPLHYVLMFPRGEDGWYPYIPTVQTSFSTSTQESVDAEFFSFDDADQ